MAEWFLSNPGFELGNSDWSATEFSIQNDAVNARTGAWVGRLIGSGVSRFALNSGTHPFRPGGRVQASCWLQGGSGGGNAFVRIRLIDADGGDLGQPYFGNQIVPGGGYLQSSLDATVTDARVKAIQIGVWFATPQGTWYVDDFVASGDVIDSIPANLTFSQYRIVPASTVGRFDPLVGSDRFQSFNSGMSDRWAGVYTMTPEILGANLNNLLTFLNRLGNESRFFAYDPDRTTPLNGVVNGMTVNGAVTQGTTRIPVADGPVSSTAMVRGDYLEIRDQYFQLQRDLQIGPEGTGDAIVWPALRSTLADGEDVITDNPKMVARVTSDLEWLRRAGDLTALTFSWEEV